VGECQRAHVSERLPLIRYVRGDLFRSSASALVNAVNCAGVMGKGIALQFKKRYPRMYEDYRSRCEAEEVQLGRISLFREGGKLIVNFPTKKHWRSKSKLEDIRTGLSSLRSLIARESIPSIALPPLGCGHGGLPWADVKAAIEDELGEVADCEIEVYEPARRPESKTDRS